MRRLLLLLTILLLSPLSLLAQGGTTFVTGQILDPTGNKYVNSQVNIGFFDPGTSGKLPLLNGSTFQTQYTYQTDSFGNLPNIVLIALPDNGTIGTSSGATGTQWIFRIVYQDRVTSFSVNLTINCALNLPATCTGNTINITAALQAAAAPIPTISGGPGTVTTFSAGTLSPLFTTSVTTPTTTPALTFSLSNATANTVFGNNTGSSTTPGYQSLVAAQEPATTVNSIVNDTNVTGSISSQALTLGWAGALAAARLNANVVQAITNDTNVTGSISAQNLTLGWTGTLAKARTLATTVYTDQSNTWSTGTQDLSAITLGRWRTSAGLTTTVNGDFGFDSTNNNWHFWNGGDLFMVPLASGFVSGHCGQPTSASGKWTIVDTGAACGVGFANPMTTLGDIIFENATPTAARLAGPTTPNGVPQYLTDVPASGLAVAETWSLAGVPTNAQTGTTYTVAVTDRANYLSFSNAGAIAVTLPQAGSTGFASNFIFVACDIGAGTATITPTTSTISYTNGSAYTSAAASMALTTGQCAWVYSDNTNYFAIQRTGGGGGGTVTTTGSPASPNLTCFSGTTSITNCANVSAHQFYGDNTASAAAPIPSLIGTSDVSVNEYVAGGGTAQTQTATLSPAATALTAGLQVCWKPTAANTAAAPTLAVNGLTATAITKFGAVALIANDLVTTTVACVIYDGTQFELMNPMAGAIYTTSVGTGTPPAVAAGTGGLFACTEGGSASGLASTDILDCNSTQHAASLNNNNTGDVPISRVLCVNISTATVNVSTTADQNLMSCTLPANLLNVIGRTIKIWVAGVYTTPAASVATINLKAKLCTVSGCGSGTVVTLATITSSANPGTVTNNAYNLTLYSTTQAAGASSVYEAHGIMGIDLGAATTSADSFFNDTNTAVSAAIDRTAQLFLQISTAFSVASGSNTSTERQLIVEVLN